MSKLVLVYDTETTGLVQNRLPPDHASQPYLVQLGAQLIDEIGWVVRAELNLIVTPEGYQIPKQASDVHGITTEMALECGVPLVVAMSAFNNLAKRAYRLVAHNLAFDDLVMRAQASRLNRELSMPSDRYCTMTTASPITCLPPTDKMRAAGFDKFKPPNLGECVERFFGEKLTGAHDAMVDVRACARVYRHLRELIIA